jgi:hypothetical protein
MTRRNWLIVAATVAALGCAICGIALTRANDGCAPLAECPRSNGTFIVRNEHNTPIAVVFVLPRGDLRITVEAHTTRASDVGCEATQIWIVDDATDEEIYSMAGGICVDKTWTFHHDSSWGLTDGLPPQ